jgi:hypothetical protein
MLMPWRHKHYYHASSGSRSFSQLSISTKKIHQITTSYCDHISDHADRIQPAFWEWTLYWMAYGNRSIYEESLLKRDCRTKDLAFLCGGLHYIVILLKNNKTIRQYIFDQKCGIHKILLCIITFYGLPESEPWRPLSVSGQSKTT